MRERLFPRWCTALFALLPMSELLYLPADGQSVYAAALACTVCALAGIGAARLSDRIRHSAPAQWVLALTSLFPLLASIARMSIFLQKTVFTGTLMRQHSCAADSLHPAHGINGAQPLCHVGTADCVACRYGTPALRRADIHTAYACQLFRTDSGISAAIPAYSVLPAAGIGRTGVFSAGDQAVPQACRADSAQAVHCSHSCCCAQCYCLELTPLPYSPIRRSLPPDWLPSAILPDTARYSSQCRSSCVRLADAPHLSARCCIRSHAPAAFCTCADRNRIWATPHN